MIAAHQPQPLGHDAHVDAMVLLPRKHGVHGAVAVDDQSQLAVRLNTSAEAAKPAVRKSYMI